MILFRSICRIMTFVGTAFLTAVLIKDPMEAGTTLLLGCFLIGFCASVGWEEKK